jgi:predicted PurR-regulated permease PerM
MGRGKESLIETFIYPFVCSCIVQKFANYIKERLERHYRSKV